MKIENLKVYDLQESIIASGYPMRTETQSQTDYAKDLKRALKLANTPANSGHGNFLTGVRVSFDLTCSNAMLVQLERYNFLDIVSSQSKMHRLKEFDFEFNVFTSRDSIQALNKAVKEYNENPTLATKNVMLMSCPMGCELTMRVSTNYMQLKNIISQRKNHGLYEWVEFCESMRNNLPLYNELIKE